MPRTDHKVEENQGSTKSPMLLSARQKNYLQLLCLFMLNEPTSKQGDASNSNEVLRVIVAAGGTGGDLFPAVAVVEQLQKMRKLEVLFVGNPERIEAKVVPQLGFRFEGLSVRGYKGVRSLQSWKMPLTIIASTLKVRRLIREFKPQLALCAGTYVSVPLALAASSAGLPLALIESNAIPGKANRRIANKADLIIAAFAECASYFSSEARKKVRVLGNPIRQAFSHQPSREEGRRHFGLDPTTTTLLVFGGSLGARSINEAIASRIEVLKNKDVQVIWQTGSSYTAPASIPSNIKVLPFINEMAEAYAAADLVLCRAGGGTVAELGVVGIPAVLIPYPYAANNEQEHNAKALQNAGAAIMIRDAELASRIDEILELLSNTEKRAAMAAAMQSFAKPQAAEDAARALLELQRR